LTLTSPRRRQPTRRSQLWGPRRGVGAVRDGRRPPRWPWGPRVATASSGSPRPRHGA
jgi:hypothetical protein